MIQFLKNINKIEKFCKDKNIKLSWSWVGRYSSVGKSIGDPNGYEIFLNPYQSFDSLMASALYFIGQCVYWDNITSGEYLKYKNSRWMVNCSLRSRFSSRYHSVEDIMDHVEVCLKEKERAFMEGRKVAHQLGISIPKSYESQYDKDVDSLKKSFE